MLVLEPRFKSKAILRLCATSHCGMLLPRCPSGTGGGSGGSGKTYSFNMYCFSTDCVLGTVLGVSLITFLSLSNDILAENKQNNKIRNISNLNSILAEKCCRKKKHWHTVRRTESMMEE